MAWMALGLLTMAGIAPARAGGPANPGVLPPQSRPFGWSYAEWSAAWWQWAYSMPADANPLNDTAPLDAGQEGKVWFLGGPLVSNPDPSNPAIAYGTANRSGTVPTGTALFFPILNVEASVLEGNGTTPADLAASAKYLEDHAVGLSATIDGAEVKGLGDYRVQSPPFPIGPLPDGNVFQDLFGLDAPAGTITTSVADGVYLMLAPLSPGVHTIHWSGAFVFTQAADGFDFTLYIDVTYTITVRPGH